MRWFGLALLGILIAAAVSIAASRLASQQIGLASEPVTAGDALAPAAKEKPTHRSSGSHRATMHQHKTPPTSPEPTEPAPEPTEPAPVPTPAPSEPQPSSPGHDHNSSEGADD